MVNADAMSDYARVKYFITSFLFDGLLADILGV